MRLSGYDHWKTNPMEDDNEYESWCSECHDYVAVTSDGDVETCPVCGETSPVETPYEYEESEV